METYGGMCKVVSMVNTLLLGRTNRFDEYGGYKPKRYIGTHTVGKVRKGVGYSDALQQGLVGTDETVAVIFNFLRY